MSLEPANKCYQNQGPKVAKMSKEKLKALQALINSALDAHGEDEEEDRLAA